MKIALTRFSFRLNNPMASLVLATCLAAGLVPSQVQANPVIDGNQISWSDASWFLVQRSDNYATICEGANPCQLEPGDYIVVNLSTGQRYEKVGITNALVGDVTVDGNIIRLPDDGWYQVQSSDNYSSVCEGRKSCLVAPGKYNVINLSRGLRYDNVIVGDAGNNIDADIDNDNDEQVSEQPVNITVTDNLIEWPDNGWYQVSRADTYEEVCAGTRNCAVDPGTYIVVNHTTGTRYKNIKVTTTATQENPYALNLVAEDILSSLAGYQADQLARIVNDMAFQIVSGSAGETLSPSSFTTQDARFGAISNATQRTRYNCSNGGTVIRETGLMRLMTQNYTHVRDVHEYLFDQCRHLITNSVLADGTYSLNGILINGERRRADPGFSEIERDYEWADFDLTGPGGLRYELDGYVSINNFTGTNSTVSSRRTAGISRYSKTVSETVIESISDGYFALAESVSDAGRLQSFLMDINGVYTGQKTGGWVVSVDTDPLLERIRDLRSTSFFERPFAGSIALNASDGSSLLLVNANPAVRPEDSFNTLLFDLLFYPASGTSIVREQIKYASLTMNAPNCISKTQANTGKTSCADGGTFFIP